MERPEPIVEEATGQLSTEEKLPLTDRPTSRFKKFLRIALFTLIGALVLFLGGGLTGWIVYTRPVQAEMRLATTAQAEEKNASQQRIDELAMEVESLSALEIRNRDLEEELEQTRRQITLLNTLTEVMTARIELAGKNIAGVRLALNNVTKFLASLESLVQADQKEAIQAMQERLKLVVGEYETNASAAESDLDVLTDNLKQLWASELSQQ